MKLVLVIFLAIIHFSIRSQSVSNDYPVVGEICPEFRLTNVHYYSQRTFDPKEVKGRWLILDFWNKRCTSCVESFPKLNRLQNEFKGEIQFLLVGQNDKKYNHNIQDIFERYTKNYKLDLAIAYDSVLFTRFGIQAVPVAIVIDPQNKVYAITSGAELTSENLQRLVENKRPIFKTTDYYAERSLRPWKYREDEDKTSERDFLYRSLLSEYQGEPQSGSLSIAQHVGQGLYQAIGARLSELYNVAYFGEGSWGVRNWDGGSFYFTHWKYPILQIRDSSHFQVNLGKGTGFYNYSLIVPKARGTKVYLMEVMQRDLKNYFGYEVSEKIKMMPYWKLSAMAGTSERLKTRSKDYQGEVGPTGVQGKRITMENILDLIRRYNVKEGIPFIDETGISEMIDINFIAVMTDMDEVRKALQKHGLILEKSEKEFKVLVIRDPKPDSKNN